MHSASIVRNCGIMLATGATACAVAIGLEAFTDPDDSDRAPHYVAGLAATVGLLLFAGVLALLVGLAGLCVQLHARRGRGTLWVAAIGLGLAIAEIPHTILDLSAIPAVYEQLPKAQAHDLVDNHFNALPGALSGVGILPLLIGSIMLARLLWSGGPLERWAPRWAIGCLIIAIVMLPMSEITWWFPHGPVLLYLGLAGYGVALVHATGETDATLRSAPADPLRSPIG